MACKDLDLLPIIHQNCAVNLFGSHKKIVFDCSGLKYGIYTICFSHFLGFSVIFRFLLRNYWFFRISGGKTRKKVQKVFPGEPCLARSKKTILDIKTRHQIWYKTRHQINIKLDIKFGWLTTMGTC